MSETIGKTKKTPHSGAHPLHQTLPNWLELSPNQIQVLESNFEKDGCFFRSIDVHTMLDCGPSPEMSLIRPVRNDTPNKPTILPNTILREEFFGGIAYDLDRHTIYYVDRLAMSVLILARENLDTNKIVEILSHKGYIQEKIDLAIRDLTTQSIIRDLDKNIEPSTIKLYKSTDLSAPFLQAPFIVELEMTHACYRECAHCAYNASPRADRAGELGTDSWKKVIKKLCDAGVLSIRFTGGDFMYRNDALELLEYTDSLGVSYHFLSDTIALSDRNLSAVKNLKNLAYIGTSIDGPDSQTHDSLRGTGAFDLLKERVKRIASQNIKLSLGTTLHKKNWHLVRETGKIANSLGATYFEVGFLCPIGRGEKLKDQVLSGEEVRESLKLYLDGVRANEYRPMQLHYYKRAQKADSLAFSDLSEIVDRLPFQTEWPFSRLRVKPDGTTYTAGKLKESGLSIGINILLHEIDTIWRSSPNLVILRDIGSGRRLHSLDISGLPKELHHD